MPRWSSIKDMLPVIRNVSASVTPKGTQSPTPIMPQEVTPSQALDTPAQAYEGPVTRSRAELLQQVGHVFLPRLHTNIDESYILPKSWTLMLLKFTHEATTLGYIKDANGYMPRTRRLLPPRRESYAPKPRVMLQVLQLPRENCTISERHGGHNIHGWKALQV
jgi:hypothetical protein